MQFPEVCLSIKVLEKIKSLLRTKIFYCVVIILCLFGILIRTKLYLFNNSLWLDEISLANNVLTSSYSKLLEPLIYNQVCPPFFCWLSKFIVDISGQAMDVHNRDFVLRILPFVSSIISLPLFAYWVQNNFKNKYFTVVSTLLMSINPLLIGYSAEFKQYSTEVLCAIILLIAFSSINVEKDSLKKIIGYSFLFCFVLWFSFSSFFILCSGLFYLLMKFINGKFSNSIKYLIIFVSSYLHFVFYYIVLVEPYYFKTYGLMQHFWGTALPSFMTFSNFVEMFVIKTSELFDVFQYPPMYAVTFVLLLIVFLSRKLIRENILVVSPIFLTIAVSFFEFYPYSSRVILFLIPMFILIYSSFVFLLKENKLTSFVVYLFAVIIVVVQFCVPIQNRVIHPDYTRELYFEMKKENPVLDNIFSADAYSYDYFALIDKTMNVYYKYEFKANRDIDTYEKELENLPADKEFWAFSPVSKISFNSQIKQYLLSNPKITVLKVYQSPTNEFDCAVKFKKNN